MSDLRFIDQSFLSEEELVDKTLKSRNLNSLKFRLDVIQTKTEDKRLISKVLAIHYILEDAYKIDMYKFQFKTFTMAMSKEIKNIEDYLEANDAL